MTKYIPIGNQSFSSATSIPRISITSAWSLSDCCNFLLACRFRQNAYCNEQSQIPPFHLHRKNHQGTKECRWKHSREICSAKSAFLELMHCFCQEVNSRYLVPEHTQQMEAKPRNKTKKNDRESNLKQHLRCKLS